MFTYYITYEYKSKTRLYKVYVYECLGEISHIYSVEEAFGKDGLTRVLARLSKEYNTTDIRKG